LAGRGRVRKRALAVRPRGGLRGPGPGRSLAAAEARGLQRPAHRGLLLRPAGAGRRLLLRPAPGRASALAGGGAGAGADQPLGPADPGPSSGCSTCGSISASGPSPRRLAPRSFQYTGSSLRYRSEDSPWRSFSGRTSTSWAGVGTW
jgi:hypothetical protein